MEPFRVSGQARDDGECDAGEPVPASPVRGGWPRGLAHIR